MNAATRVRIYCDGHDRTGDQLLVDAVVHLLWREHAAGVTVVRGAEGFGVNRHLHAGRRERLGANLPVVIEWLDTPERCEAIWPLLHPLLDAVLVTRESVEVIAWPAPGMRRLDATVSVDEVMSTDLVTVQASTSLADVVALMVGRGRRFVPVLDRTQLAGVITNGDLVNRAGLAARIELGQPAQPLSDRAWAGRTAADVMSDEPVAVLSGTRLAEVARLMTSHRVKRIPVLRQGRLVGVVSRLDVLRTVASELTNGNGESEVTEPVTQIGQLAHGRVPAVSAQAGLGRVLDAVASTRLNHAVVVDADQRVVGLITDAELLRRVGAGHRGLVDRLMRRDGELAASPRTAADLMVPVELLVPASEGVSEALRQMLDKEVKVLPVVDHDGRLTGIVDRADALRALFGTAAEEEPPSP